MDPALPEWRAFGQPEAARVAEPARPDDRRSVAERLAQVPRSTRVSLAIAGLLAAGGLGLALLTPAGSDVALPEAALAFDGLVSGAATSLVTGPAMPAADLVVDVAGAVVDPGLVRLGPGARVGDAIAAAGGYAPTVDLDATAGSLNLAASLEDGMKVLVPSLGADGVSAAGAGGNPDEPSGGLVDLNSASASELEALPGIGEVTAARILEARTQAPFAGIDELRGRGLVGDSTYGRLRDLVTVRR